MKIIQSLIVAGSIVLLNACATAPPTQPPEMQFTDSPAIGLTASSDIGETLVTKGKVYVFDGLELFERITDNGSSREYIVEPSAMRLGHVDAHGNKYFVPPFEAYYVNDKMFGKRVRPSNDFLVVRKDGSLELRGFYDLSSAGKISPETPQYKLGKIVDKYRPNFRQELIYGGRIGDQIKLTYREFSNDLIRPGFAQEVQYDISSDPIVGFKGVRIEVLSATNTKITYRVLKSFPNLN